MITIEGVQYKVITIYRVNKDGVKEPFDIYELIK
jgi:hypothetical protein